MALACAALYLAGVLFLVLNKRTRTGRNSPSIVLYWDLYADDAQLRKFQLAIGVSRIGLMVLLPARPGRRRPARDGRCMAIPSSPARPKSIAGADVATGSRPSSSVATAASSCAAPGQLSVMLSAPTAAASRASGSSSPTC